MDPELQKALDEIGRKTEALRTEREILAKRLGPLEKTLGIGADGEAKHNLETLAGQIIDLENNVTRLKRARGSAEVVTPELLDAKGRRIHYTNPLAEARAVVTGSKEFHQALNNVLRDGGHCFKAADLADLEVAQMKRIPDSVGDYVQALMGTRDAKAIGLSTDFLPGGGVAAPPEIEREITRVAIEFSAMDQYARVVNVGKGHYVGLVRNANRETIQNLGEREAATVGTQTDRYEERRIDVYTQGISIGLTHESIEDTELDLVAELTADAAFDFMVKSGRNFVKGSGSKEAEGVMTNTEIATYNSGSTATFTMNSLKNLCMQLKREYRGPGARYYFSRGGLTTVMLWRTDSGAGANTGPYMWEPSTQAGTPSRINGFEWAELIDMDDVAADAFPVLFGDMYRGYRIVRRRGVSIMRDDYTQKPYVIFDMNRREGGKVWLPEALVKLKCHT